MATSLFFLVTSRPDVDCVRDLIRRLDTAAATTTLEHPVQENCSYSRITYEIFADGAR